MKLYVKGSYFVVSVRKGEKNKLKLTFHLYLGNAATRIYTYIEKKLTIKGKFGIQERKSLTCTEGEITHENNSFFNDRMQWNNCRFWYK